MFSDELQPHPPTGDRLPLIETALTHRRISRMQLGEASVATYDATTKVGAEFAG